jgi:hypothetical protein
VLNKFPSLHTVSPVLFSLLFPFYLFLLSVTRQGLCPKSLALKAETSSSLPQNNVLSLGRRILAITCAEVKHHTLPCEVNGLSTCRLNERIEVIDPHPPWLDMLDANPAPHDADRLQSAGRPLSTHVPPGQILTGKQEHCENHLPLVRL